MMEPHLFDLFDGDEKQKVLKALERIISQTEEAQGEYKALRELFDSVIDSLPNALWVLEESGEIYLFNSEARRLDAHILTHVDYEKERTELEFAGEFYLIKLKSISTKIIVSMTNITESKRNERLASMGSVAAHLAHEIRNPISAISIDASQLFSKVDIKLKPTVYNIKKALWRIERIIKTTLLFTKGIEARKTSFYIDEFEDDMDEALGFYAYTKDIEIDYKLPHEKIEADFNLLSIVFQNLLFNAIDAIEDSDDESGKIEVAYSEDMSHHIFYFYDTGIEVEDEEILFEAYKTTKTKGNGLGLALSQRIIKAHFGEITLKKHPKSFIVSIEKIDKLLFSS